MDAVKVSEVIANRDGGNHGAEQTHVSAQRAGAEAKPSAYAEMRMPCQLMRRQVAGAE